jgi:hypothetical protein
MFIRPMLSFIARDAAPENLPVPAPCVPLELPMDLRFFICSQILWDECHNEKLERFGFLSRCPSCDSIEDASVVRVQNSMIAGMKAMEGAG